MNVIAAVDANWAIGDKNDLLVRIPHDQKWFQQVTTGKVIVMGRKTLETFPNGLPLKNRVNIVLTNSLDFKVKGAVIVNDIESLMKELEKYNSEDVFVIGGESVYSQLIDKCDTAYITKIDYKYQADRYFPNLEKMEEWVLESESDEQTYFDLLYTFNTYVKR